MQRPSVNIIGRVESFTGIGQHTEAFISCLSDAFDINLLNSRPHATDQTTLLKLRKTYARLNYYTQYDIALQNSNVSVFVDVTANDANDTNWQKVPVTKCKYIYSVFDSTRIPLPWCDIINNHFDAVFVPSKFLVDVYRKSLVHKPVFHLPLALELQPYLTMPTGRLHEQAQIKKRPFVFTFIGSRERRKNVDLLLDCFHETFADCPDVLLRVHCALDFYHDDSYAERVAKKYANVIFTQGVISSEQYEELIRMSDCFVSLSKGEGYAIPPRQFLAAGKPVILSDCFAHNEILQELNALGEDLAFEIDASIPVIGEYEHVYGGGKFGLQYDVYRPAVIDTLWQVFNKRHSLYEPNKVEARRRWAERYDVNTLRKTYQSIILPAFCRMSTGNALEFGGITTSDANLASRISGRNFSLSGWQEVSNKPRKIVVIANDGGFFSVFNRFISYLTWTLSENPDSIVIPDWRIESMKRHWGKDRFTSFCYGRPEDGNIWLKLFKPLPYREFPESSYNSDEDCYRNAELKDDYNEKNEPWLTYVHAYKLYRSPGFARWRHWYHLYFSTYVHLRDSIQQRIDEFYIKNLSGFRVIGVHIRHPSHGVEQPGLRMPTVELYCHRISELMGQEGLSARNTRIFLATDQDSVIDQLRREFGDMIVYTGDATRTSRAQDAHFNSLPERLRRREGYQIQHVTASNPARWSTAMAEEVIIDTYLLAKADYFLHVTSNIATAVAYMNPRIRMIYCE